MKNTSRLTTTVGLLWIAATACQQSEPVREVRQYSIEQFLDTVSLRGASISHDDKLMLYGSDASGLFNAYTVPVTGGEATQLTHSTEDNVFPVSFFPNDNRILYQGDKGGQFFTGDGHAVQGDGEVDGGAIEISLKPTLQFIVHKGKTIKQPRVESATDYLTTGLDIDLNVATRIAMQEAVDFLQEEKGMSAADAYALSSLAVDLGIGEAVDVVNLVYAKIPKNIFKNNREFWHKPA
jgi:hypothetical protein